MLNSIIIEAGTLQDIDELENLYNDLNDSLEKGTNYPGWMKGIYPIRKNAEIGIQQGFLFTAKIETKIAGTFILSHEPEPAYSEAEWKTENEYDKIIVIHTLAVHPEFKKCGIGKALMEFAESHSREQGMQSIRLDVYENNKPAIKLYEDCGFEYITTVDLGLGEYGLFWYKLYEKILVEQ